MKWQAILFMIIFLYGCGYHVVGTGKSTSKAVYSVAIPVFENRTTEPRAEFIFTEALRREFLKRGDLILTSIQDADVVFRGKIIKLDATGIAHNRFNQTVESKFFVTIDIRCEDRRTGNILWQDNRLTFSRSYPYGSTGFEDYRARRAALEYIAQQVAERIYSRFMSKIR